MGSVPQYFEVHTATWLAHGWLPTGGRLLDYGAQELMGGPDVISTFVERFLKVHGASAEGCIGPDGRYRVAKIFEAIGIRYTAIDVDGQFGSTFFDLNTEAPPLEWVDQFDFVNNE